MKIILQNDRDNIDSNVNCVVKCSVNKQIYQKHKTMSFTVQNGTAW